MGMTYENEYGTWTYKKIWDGGAIEKFKPKNDQITEVEIPREINGVNITEIGRLAFCQLNSITKITIPDSVTLIDMDAFAYCCHLTQINIPDSVTKIEYGAFNCCTKLPQIIIPPSVLEIGYCVFRNCRSLT